jgi:hypothetical protein
VGFFDRIGSAWGALFSKSAPPGSYGAGWGGGPIWSDAFRSRRAPTPYELVEAYRSLVYSCVNLNANAVARLPLRLYATTKKGQFHPKCPTKAVSRTTKLRLKSLDYTAKAMAHAEEVEEVTDHPLLDAVMRVNDDLDHTQLLTYTVMSLDIVGSAYWWPFLGRMKLPEEFWALPPHLVSPMFTSGSMVPDSYQFGGVNYPKGSLIRFRRLSARNPYGQGYGPTQGGIEYARLEDTFISVQDDMLSNGPRPSVIVSHKDPKGAFGPAERTRLENDMNRKGRGGRTGSAFVVDGAVAVTPISYTPTDLGTKELSLYDLERLANCFDVPVSMLKTEDVNRANAEAGLEQHGRNAVEPRCKLIASTLTRWTRSLDVGGKRGWDRLLWAFDPAVNADRQADADLHKTYVSMGLPLNVALTEAGYDAVEGGDEPLVASGMVTLDSLVNPPEPAPPPTGQPGADETADEGEDEADSGTEDNSEDEAPDDQQDESEPDAEVKAVHADIASLSAKILVKIDRLADEQLAVKGRRDRKPGRARSSGRRKPCHDQQGHFTACGGAGSGAPAAPHANAGRKPKPPAASGHAPASGGKPQASGANKVTQADRDAAKATPRIEHPKSDADVPRFVKETSDTPVFKAVNAKMDALAKDTPSGDVRRWSLDKHSGPGGVLTPERQKLHNKIVNETLNPEAVAKPGVRPKAAILMGPPGSGKTTGGQPQTDKLGVKFTVVNADDVKAKLPEYQGWNAAVVHEESSHIAEHRIRHEAVAARHNVLMDLTGANTGKMKNMVEEFDKAGYDVHLVNIDLPAYKATGRAWDRFTGNAFGHKDPKGEPGRFVPPSYVYNTVGDKPKATFAALKKHPAVRSYVSVSTDVPRGTAPRVTEEGGNR